MTTTTATKRQRKSAAAAATGVSTEVLTPERALALSRGVVFLDVRINGMDFVRAIRDEELPEELRIADTEEQRKALHHSKELIERSALRPLRRPAQVFKNWLEFRALSTGSLSRGGVYVIPVALIAEVETGLATLTAEINEQVELLLERYDTLKDAQKERLGPLYREADYPTPAAIRAKYRVDARWVTMNIPDQLQAISADLYEREQERVKQQWQDAFADVREALRTSFLGFIKQLSVALEPEKNGRKKGLRDDSFNALGQFFATFEARNIAGDEELARLVGEARALLAGANAKTLKEADARLETKKEIDAIASSLSKLVKVEGVRRVSFSDDL